MHLKIEKTAVDGSTPVMNKLFSLRCADADNKISDLCLQLFWAMTE